MKSYNFGKNLNPLDWEYITPMIPIGEAAELPYEKGWELWWLLNLLWRS